MDVCAHTHRSYTTHICHTLSERALKFPPSSPDDVLVLIHNTRSAVLARLHTTSLSSPGYLNRHQGCQHCAHGGKTLLVSASCRRMGQSYRSPRTGANAFLPPASASPFQYPDHLLHPTDMVAMFSKWHHKKKRVVGEDFLFWSKVREFLS